MLLEKKFRENLKLNFQQPYPGPFRVAQKNEKQLRQEHQRFFSSIKTIFLQNYQQDFSYQILRRQSLQLVQGH